MTDACRGSDQLTSDEQWLVGKLHEGETADFSDRGGGTIRSTVLRNLLLRHHVSGECRSRIPLAGIRIHGACIVGELDLADLARPGTGLPALILENCNLPYSINLAGSRFARLSIRKSRFGLLNMRECEIDGPFDFSEAKPCIAPDGKPAVAWIDAQGCVVNGQITGSKARLVAPPARNAADVKGGDRRYALWLANADVRGSVILLDNFVAEGGVCLRSARIRGDIWATGARITAREGFALNAQAARIGDLVALDKGFRAKGKVWLLASRIGGLLLLDGATLRGTDDNDSEEAHRGRKALQADNVQIGADVRMGENFKAYGEVSFSGASIHGSLQCQQALFSNRTPDGQARALIAAGAEVGNEVLFDGATVKGLISLNGAHIGGRLSFNGAKIANKTTDGSGVALSAVGAQIGGTFRFEKFRAHPSTVPRQERIFRCGGCAKFDGANVGGDLVFEGSSLRNYTDGGSGIALSAKRIHVGGNVEFNGAFSAQGAAVLDGATVGRSVCFKSARFGNKNGTQSAICGSDMQIGADLQFENTDVKGDLGFERIEVSGTLLWDKLKISRRREDNLRASLDLRHARIGSVLKAKCLSFVGLVDVCGMQVSTLSHALPQGWGSGASACRVNFDGLTYDRIILETAGCGGNNSLPEHYKRLLPRILGPLQSQSPLAKKYCQWLKLQENETEEKETAHDENFFPQPYRQLARVLRNQGDESAARDIAIAEQWAARKEGLLPFVARWAFGIGFGFGLRPRNAILTIAGFLLVGAIGVGMAKHGDMLKESVVVTSTGAQFANSDDRVPVHLKRAILRLDANPSDPATEIDCTDAANTWTDDLVYAADMLVPFIPLHQEGKCEIVPNADWRSGVWRSLKAAYSVTGWVIFSLALVTFSGVLRKFDRDSA